nr:PDZ domain-containing protein [Pseudoxanthomonas spadix]
MLGLLALQAVRLAWLVAVPPAPVGAFRPDAVPQAPVTPTGPTLDPFFPPDSAASQATASGVTLHGISTGPGGASAILGDSQGPQRSLRVGESMPSGVRLAGIGPDHVWIESSQGRQRLDFAAAPVSRSAAGTLPSAAPVAPVTGAASAPVDPARLLEQAGLVPREVNGQVSSYTLIPRGDGAALRKAGLQAGDVLLSVNGQALTPERYHELAAELAGRDSVELTVQRDGATRSVTVPLQ